MTRQRKLHSQFKSASDISFNPVITSARPEIKSVKDEDEQAEQQ